MKIHKFQPKLHQFGLLLATALLALNASAQSEPYARRHSPFSLGIEAGTTGIGPVLNYTASPKLNFSLSYAYLGADFDDAHPKKSKSRYDGTLDFTHVAAVVDWHPTGGRFHLSTGAIFFDHKLEGAAKPINGTYLIGDHSYDITQVTTLKGTAENNSSVAPYVGFGWTWVFGDSGFSLAANFGAMFTGRYNVKLTAEGPVVAASTVVAGSPYGSPFLADLHKEEESLADGHRVYPVAKIGITYRF